MGSIVGCDDGAIVGALEGSDVGSSVGTGDGAKVGALEGSDVGSSVGNNVGSSVGTSVGEVVGTGVGLDLVSEAEVISTYCIISKSTIRLQDTFKHDFIVIFANTCAYKI